MHHCRDIFPSLVFCVASYASLLLCSGLFMCCCFCSSVPFCLRVLFSHSLHVVSPTSHAFFPFLCCLCFRICRNLSVLSLLKVSPRPSSRVLRVSSPPPGPLLLPHRKKKKEIHKPLTADCPHAACRKLLAFGVLSQQTVQFFLCCRIPLRCEQVEGHVFLCVDISTRNNGEICFESLRSL